MRILIATPVFRPVPSGAGERILDISSQLVQMGESVTILTHTRAEVESHSEWLDGARIVRLPGISLTPVKRVTRRLSQFAQLAWYIARHARHADALLINGPSRESGLLVALAQRLGLRVVVWLTLYGSDDPCSLAKPVFPTRLGALPNSILRRMVQTISYADVVVCHSSQLVDAVRTAPGWGRASVVFVPSAVDTVKFHPVSQHEKADLRKAFGSSEYASVFLYCGWLSLRKGIDLLLAAWTSFLKESKQPAELWLVGSVNPDEEAAGEVWGKLVAPIKNSPGGESVKLIGDVSAQEVAKYYQACDAFVFPTRREGFPRAVIEAMACGVPVILSRRPEIFGTLLENGRGVISFPPDSSSQLATAMLHLSGRPELRQRLAAEARAAVKQSFTTRMAAENLIQVLQE